MGFWTIVNDIENLTFEYPRQTTRPQLVQRVWRNAKTSGLNFYHTISSKFQQFFHQLDILISKIGSHGQPYWILLKKYFSLNQAIKLLDIVLSKSIPRAIASFTLGFLFVISILVWQMNVSWHIAIPVGMILGIIITVLFDLSPTFRCVICLSVPQFTSQHGRFILLLVISSFLLAGPIRTVSENANKISTSISCFSEMSKEQGEDFIKTFSNAFDKFKNTSDKFTKDLKNIRQQMEHIYRPTQLSLQYLIKSFNSATNKLKIGVENCDSFFRNTKDDCLSRSKEAYYRCRILIPRDINFICDMVKIADDVCTPLFVGKGQWCDFPLFVQEIFDSLSQKAQDILESIQYELKSDAKFDMGISNTFNITAIRRRLKDEYESNLQFIDTTLDVLKYLLGLSVIAIPIKSYKYLKKFQRYSRSNAFGKLETFNEVDRHKELCIQVLLLAIHFCFVLILLTLDLILYWIQKAVVENTTGDLESKAHFSFHIKLNLGEFWSSSLLFLLKRLVPNMELKFEADYDYSTPANTCIKVPELPYGLKLLLPIIFTYGIIIFFLNQSNRILKKRCCIVRYFFPNLPRVIKRDRFNYQNPQTTCTLKRSRSLPAI